MELLLSKHICGIKIPVVLLSLGPQTPAPAPAYSPQPRPLALFTFLRPPTQITFSRPLTMELLFHGLPASKIIFSLPLVIRIVCRVFFYSLKQISTYSLFLSAKCLIYINQSIAV